MKFAMIGLVMLLVVLTACNTQSGKSIDYVYGYDQGLVWDHLYLTNDHTTAYCFKMEDANLWQPIFDEALKSNAKIEVDYAKYMVKGSLCSANQGMETVVVTNVKLLGNGTR